MNRQLAPIRIRSGSCPPSLAGALATGGAFTALTTLFQTPDWYGYVALGIVAMVGPILVLRNLTASHSLPILSGGAISAVAVVAAAYGHRLLPGVVSSQPGFDLRSALAHDPPAPLAPELAVVMIGAGALVALIVEVWAVVLERPAGAGVVLALVYTIPLLASAQRVPWWAFAVGAGGYLILLVVGATDPERRTRQGAARRGRLRALGSRFAAGGLPLTFGAATVLVGIIAAQAAPASLTADGLLERFRQSQDTGGHAITTVHPMTRMRGYLTQARSVNLLHLHTDDPQPLYLRITTLDRFSEAGWTQSRLSATQQQQVRSASAFDNEIAPRAHPRLAHTQVEITGMTDSPYLPIYPNPTRISATGDWRWDRRTQTVFSTRRTTGGLRYSFTSQRVPYDPQLAEAAPPVRQSSNLAKTFTQTEGETPRVVSDLVRQLTSPRQTAYQNAMALQNYFSPQHGFSYSEQTAPGTTGNDVVDFLRNRRGYCEQYASTMAYLARVAGLPARVAIGFSHAKTQNGDIAITNRNAHAWVEIYFTGLGWVPFDPTPADDTNEASRITWTTNQPGAPTSTAPSTAASAPSSPASPTGAKGRDSASDASHAKVKGASEAAWRAATLTLGVALVVVTLCLGPGTVRQLRRRQRLRQLAGSPPRRAAHLAWAELTDTAIDFGWRVDPKLSPRSWIRRFAKTGPLSQSAPPADIAAFHHLSEAEEKASYARSVAAVPEIGAALRHARTVIITAASRKAQLMAWLWPRSLRAQRAFQGWPHRKRRG